MIDNNLPKIKRFGLIQPSTLAFFDEARKTKNFSTFDKMHGYIYARFLYTYISIGIGQHKLNRVINPIITFYNCIQAGFQKLFPVKSTSRQTTLADTYHGKVLPLTSVKQLVSVQENIRLENLETIIPYLLAKDIILNHPDHLVVLDCPCRSSRENPCLPLDVCMVVGEPFASFVLEHHPQKSRSISKQEALQILEDEDNRGHVHHAFFKDAMLGRFYAICNCCSCCCGAIQAHEHGTPMLSASGFLAIVDHDICIDCGICNSYCQFHAISLVDGFNTVNAELCMGCGICISKCDLKALSLSLNPLKGIPLDIDQLMKEAAITGSH
jgi:Pyruvate/2-oxoacid:ferredoxin oxidoreductase delta subunit